MDSGYEKEPLEKREVPSAPTFTDPQVQPEGYDPAPQYGAISQTPTAPDYDDPPPPYSTVTDYQTVYAPNGYAYPPPLLPYHDGAAIAAAAEYEAMAARSRQIVESHHAELAQQEPSICCVDQGYLKEIEGNEVYINHIERNRRSLPQIKFRIQCYHYEYRTEYYRDSEGNQQYRQVRERVNTHSATRYLRYNQCWDFTKYPSAIDCGADFARVHFVKEYAFKDDFSRDEYERQKVNFINMNNRDNYYDLTEDYELAGFRERMIVKLTDAETPACMSPCCCCLAHMFFGCMCYTHWFHNQTTKLNVVSLKVIQISGYW